MVETDNNLHSDEVHVHHHHHHSDGLGYTSSSWPRVKRALIWGIVLNTLYFLIEFFYGLRIDSMALISDAGHNLGDVLCLLISLLAFRLARIAPTAEYTYGYKRATIMASLLNGVILLVAVGLIVAESIDKLLNPVEVEGNTIAWVAAIGIAVNAFTALIIQRTRRSKDLNVKSAYLHMVADALVSLGVVVSGLIIGATGWTFIDPIIGLVVAVVILVSTSQLLFDSLKLSLDGVPVGIRKGRLVAKIVNQVPGVKDIHHVHIWAVSTDENAITAHVVVNDFGRMAEIKSEVRQLLRDEGITHSTLEFECPEEHCDSIECSCGE